MDAVAPALIGIGLWLCYEAWTNPDAAPLVKIKSALGGPLSGSGTVSSPYTTTASGGAPVTPAGTAAAAAASGYNVDVP